MEIQSLVPVEWKAQLVLTSVQVVQGLGCSVDAIKMNFKNHRELYVEGVHYFKLTGEALRTFRRQVNLVYPATSPHHISKYASNLYLWTYQGVVRHSKLIDTPEAWKMFDELERAYFGVIKSAPTVEEELLPAPESDSERTLIRMKKQLAAIKKFEFAVVYMLLMGNGTVKIGYTKDLTERVKQIKAETGLDVLNFKTSPFMILEEARALEAALHEKYAADCLGGEYYDIKFIDACKDI